jgi:tetratricopeptide (TPR) repeat protein
MQEVSCSRCGRSVPTNESVVHEAQSYCGTCAEELKNQPGLDWAGAHPGVDPTVCAWCGKDNCRHAFSTDGVAPVCPDCHARQVKRPLPTWVKLFLAAVVVIAVGGFAANARFFQAWMDYRACGPALASGDYARAASTMAAAARLVPESTDLVEVAGLYQAISFLAANRSTEALPLFQQWARNHPEDDSVAGLALQAELGAAFDNRRYQDMYAASVKLRDRNPRDYTPMLGVASAAACLYAETGETHYHQEAQGIIAVVRGGVSPSDSADAEEYIARILYRLESRQIIDQAEYYRRFPVRERSAK